MGMYTQDSGAITKQIGRVYTKTQLALAMKVTGVMISSMVKAERLGPTVHFTRATTLMEKEKALVSTVGLMDHHTKEIGLTTKSKDLVPTFGKMAGNVTVSGMKVSCQATES